MDIRQLSLQKWLADTTRWEAVELQALPGDASFRRYFRVWHQQNSYIAMDAPPDRENCQPFVAIAKVLRQHGLLSPEIIEADLSQGFLLLTDFGDRQYLKELTAENADKLYTIALDALAILQQCRAVPGASVPFFTAEFMYQELLLFQEWFLENYLQLTLTSSEGAMLANCYHKLAQAAASQVQVFMHRDYHSANLMCLPENQVGILDFQDAFIGPVTYDLVSLLRDCYIEWPDDRVKKWVLYYRQVLQLNVSESEFLQWFDWMGLQRHMKALLTFSRKFKRDQNPHYLQHVPRTLNYILKVSEMYPEFKAFYHFLHEKVLPAVKEVNVCAQ